MPTESKSCRIKKEKSAFLCLLHHTLLIKMEFQASLNIVQQRHCYNVYYNKYFEM